MQDKKNKNSGDDEENLFQLWINELNHDELCDAMKFQLEMNTQEYRLLRDMIQLQPAPTIPIHPRALSFKLSSINGANDGRNECKRKFKTRFCQPRLFQLFSRGSSFTNNNASTAIPPKNNRLHRKAQNQPSETFDVMARTFKNPWAELLTIGCTKVQQEADKDIIINASIEFPSLQENKSYQNNKNRNYSTRKSNENSFCTVCPFSTINIRSTSTASNIRKTLRIASRGNFARIIECREKESGNPSFCARWLTPTERWFSLSMYLASRVEIALWDEYCKGKRITSKKKNIKNQKQQVEKNKEKTPFLNLSFSILQKSYTQLIKEILKIDEASDVNTNRNSSIKSPTTSYIRDGLLYHLLFTMSRLYNSTTMIQRISNSRELIDDQSQQSKVKRKNNNEKENWQGMSHKNKKDSSIHNLYSMENFSEFPLIELGSRSERIRILFKLQLQIQLAIEMEKELLKGLWQEEDIVGTYERKKTNFVKSSKKETRANASSIGRKRRKNRKYVNQVENNGTVLAEEVVDNQGNDNDTNNNKGRDKKVKQIRASLQQNQDVQGKTVVSARGESNGNQNPGKAQTPSNKTSKSKIVLKEQKDYNQGLFLLQKPDAERVERSGNKAFVLFIINEMIDNVFETVGLRSDDDDQSGSKELQDCISKINLEENGESFKPLLVANKENFTVVKRTKKKHLNKIEKKQNFKKDSCRATISSSRITQGTQKLDKHKSELNKRKNLVSNNSIGCNYGNVKRCANVTSSDAHTTTSTISVATPCSSATSTTWKKPYLAAASFTITSSCSKVSNVSMMGKRQHSASTRNETMNKAFNTSAKTSSAIANRQKRGSPGANNSTKISAALTKPFLLADTGYATATPATLERFSIDESFVNNKVSSPGITLGSRTSPYEVVAITKSKSTRGIPESKHVIVFESDSFPPLTRTTSSEHSKISQGNTFKPIASETSLTSIEHNRLKQQGMMGQCHFHQQQHQQEKIPIPQKQQQIHQSTPHDQYTKRKVQASNELLLDNFSQETLRQNDSRNGQNVISNISSATSTSQNQSMGVFLHRPEVAAQVNFGWDANDGKECNDNVCWGGFNLSHLYDHTNSSIPTRQESILTDFFLEQVRSDVSREERIMTSSTAASIASTIIDNNYEEVEEVSIGPAEEQSGAIDTRDIDREYKSHATDNFDRAVVDSKLYDKVEHGIDNDRKEKYSLSPEIDKPGTNATKLQNQHGNTENFHSSTAKPRFGDKQEDKDAGFDNFGDPHNSGSSRELEIAKLTIPLSENECSLPQVVKGRNDVTHNYDIDTDNSNLESGSSSPQAPATPSPRLSPILVSLADIRNIRELPDLRDAMKSSGIGGATASLPSSPVQESSRRGLVSSWSRDDLRKYAIDSKQTMTDGNGASALSNSTHRGYKQKASSKNLSRDGLKRTSGGNNSKKNSEIAQDADSKKKCNLVIAMQASTNKAKQGKVSDEVYRQKYHARIGHNLTGATKKQETSGNFKGSGAEGRSGDHLCAKSETGLEDRECYQQWHDSNCAPQEELDNNTLSKDGSTTITSALSHRDTEETSLLKEERNTFRDMCLTLGAEVAKLRNLVAAQKCSTMCSAPTAIDNSLQPHYSAGFTYPTLGPGSFDPECMPPFYQNRSNGKVFAAMSDVGGMHRGEYESQMSEEDVHNSGNKNVTAAGSDISVEHLSTSQALQGRVGVPIPLNRDGCDSLHGLQSRLTKDIFHFLDVANVLIQKRERKINLAVERMTRLVNAVWPRAQVKLYGSHVTGLCLPSSDLDFVICLPAVHKNAPADAPGVLEGRNAINETSQKLFSRRLKGESWVDPRSMLLIERTVVPVIKVSTKDTRANSLQLDVTFDSPEHHGLEAIEMVTQIVKELPMIRPLVLVLKQFLLKRGLLTAYTGGLSSYCLFLMVARYLQEQPRSWGDCGSLLMGFLDYYGNCFDPRSTGISVGRRQYFARPNFAAERRRAAGQQMWNVQPSPVSGTTGAGSNNEFFIRRNSFSDMGNVDCLRGAAPAASSLKTRRFQSSPSPPPSRFATHGPHRTNSSGSGHISFDHGMPFTFDPLFVDDPLSTGNNVGRNAFRIFQVQRAFSDAHRALVASLEWDIQSSGEMYDGVDYPLLKCLLQSEDVLYEL